MDHSQKLLYLILFLFVNLLNTVFSTNTDSDNKSISLRLPRNLLPKLYKLEVKPYLDPIINFTFEGKVTISFDCKEDTNVIVLHSKDLIINEGTVKFWHEKGKRDIPIKKHEYDLKRDFYIVHPETFIKAGESYQIQMEFKGDLGDKLIGFYRGSYNDSSSGEQRWFATTQFEPIYCRRAFPSFDEPDFKAEFEISITRLKKMTSVSNMPLKATTDSSDSSEWVTDNYERTVPMSTYLVAYIVFDFGHLESPDGKFRVWARKDALEHTRYALSIGPQIQKHFEEYFGIEFPLPKQDLVAVPDFYHGAMENFGLITFRETGMLYDPNKTSDAGQHLLAHTISHELSHQWFGNLVTMKWFDGLWLNEGFAAYVEYIGVEKVQPTWHTMDSFVTSDVHPVLDFDAWNYTHPIWVHVENPDDIDELFDFISYKKGASIIRMMANFLSEKTMRAGLSNYLKKWKYNNTVQEDLWDSLTKQAYTDKTLGNSVTVKDIMDTWTIQKGFPIVYVQRVYNGSNKVILTQKKFTFSQDFQNDNSSWYIPISYSTPKHNSDFQQTRAELWLTNKDKSLEVEIDIQEGQWLIVNVQQTGFFRVNYDAENWALIKSQLDKDFHLVHLVNRGQIINDLFNLARISSIPYELAFDVTTFIRNDDEFVPWQSYFGSTNYIDSVLETTPTYGKFKEYMRKQLSNQYNVFGFEGKEGATRPQKLHRSNIISYACYYGVQKCVDFAKNKFVLWMNSSNPGFENTIRKNFRGSVYCVSVRNGGENEWNFLWKIYLNSTVDADRVTILSALACTREVWILNRFMKWAISPVAEGNIPQQHVSVVLGSVARTVIGSKFLIRFLDNNWEGLFKRLGKPGLQHLDGIIKSITSRLNTPSDLKQFVSLKGNKDFGPATLSVNQGLERIQTNIQWMEMHYPRISKWLSQKTNS